MIFCECYNDETLLRALGKARKEVKHNSNKFEVCKSLKKNNDSIGLLDQDPGKLQDRYTEGLTKTYEDNGIMILEDRQSNNKVIVLCPELEPWLNKAFKESGIAISNYHLPSDLHEIGTNDSKLLRLRHMITDALPTSKMLKSLRQLL